MWAILLNPHTDPMEQIETLILLLVVDEKTEVQRGSVTCPVSHSKLVELTLIRSFRCQGLCFYLLPNITYVYIIIRYIFSQLLNHSKEHCGAEKNFLP